MPIPCSRSEWRRSSDASSTSRTSTTTSSRILAAKAIVDHSFADRVFFCNSGAEANEGALKLARRFQDIVNGAPERTTFVSTVGSFHGRTFATVAITGQAKYREHFGPLVGLSSTSRTVTSGPRRALSRTRPRARSSSSRSRQRAASSSAAGVPRGAAPAVRRHQTNFLIFDEVQTGMGRTGKWFGTQHDKRVPDVMSSPEGLRGGGADRRRRDDRAGRRRGSRSSRRGGAARDDVRRQLARLAPRPTRCSTSSRRSSSSARDHRVR